MAVLPSGTASSKAATALQAMRMIMGKMGHLTFRGQVHILADGSRHTYKPCTTPQRYIDRWLKIPAVSPFIQEYESKLKSHLENVDNCLCDEVVFDYDLIEVCM